MKLDVVDLVIPKTGVTVFHADNDIRIRLPLAAAQSLLYALRDLEVELKRVDI